MQHPKTSLSVSSATTWVMWIVLKDIFQAYVYGMNLDGAPQLKSQGRSVTV
jgi:hypothetical protein